MSSANNAVRSVISEKLSELEGELNADLIFLKSPLVTPVDDHVRWAVEAIRPKSDKKKLIVLLETDGGYVEVVERIVRVFREHYEEVSFIIPSHAYSAGTILALSGDEIYMDYHSVLGPIDPQHLINGSYLPGMGYLAKYKELVEEINAAEDSALVRAQVTYLLAKFEPVTIFHIEQAIEHSKELLRDWLPKYKFKGWTKTKTRKKRVTDEMKKDRADDIAKILGRADYWHSHGRGIGILELMGDEIKLEIVDYGKDLDLSSMIKSYYNLTVDYLQKNQINNAIHSKSELRHIP